LSINASTISTTPTVVVVVDEPNLIAGGLDIEVDADFDVDAVVDAEVAVDVVVTVLMVDVDVIFDVDVRSSRGL